MNIRYCFIFLLIFININVFLFAENNNSVNIENNIINDTIIYNSNDNNFSSDNKDIHLNKLRDCIQRAKINCSKIELYYFKDINLTVKEKEEINTIQELVLQFEYLDTLIPEYQELYSKYKFIEAEKKINEIIKCSENLDKYFKNKNIMLGEFYLFKAIIEFKLAKKEQSYKSTQKAKQLNILVIYEYEKFFKDIEKMNKTLKMLNNLINKDLKNAEDTLNKLLSSPKIENIPYYYYKMSIVKYKLNKIEEAKKYYKIAVELDPLLTFEKQQKIDKFKHNLFK